MDAQDAAQGHLPRERNLMLVVEYDGTRYHGFQLQAGAVPTVQAELERALVELTGTAIRVAGAGRTDRGVHASGQVVNFHTRSSLSVLIFQRALNALLPRDVAVVSANEAASEFHARFSARSREYRYTILNRRSRPALERHYCWHVPAGLNVAAMGVAAEDLLGEHDFASFAGRGEFQSTVRRVYSAAFSREAERVFFDIEADAFLPHMVRNVVGTLFLVGTGKLDLSGFREIVTARNRSLAGPTAPARGLCLTRVNY